MRKEKNEIYNAKAVGERIRSLRDSKGITQEYLAEKFGSKIETMKLEKVKFRVIVSLYLRKYWIHLLTIFCMEIRSRMIWNN